MIQLSHWTKCRFLPVSTNLTCCQLCLLYVQWWVQASTFPSAGSKSSNRLMFMFKLSLTCAVFLLQPPQRKVLPGLFGLDSRGMKGGRTAMRRSGRRGDCDGEWRGVNELGQCTLHFKDGVEKATEKGEWTFRGERGEGGYRKEERKVAEGEEGAWWRMGRGVMRQMGG